MNTQVAWWLAAAAWLLACLAATVARALGDFSRTKLEDVARARRNPDRLGEILCHHTAMGEAVDGLRVLATSGWWGALVALVASQPATPSGPDWTAWPRLFLGGMLGQAMAEIWIAWSVGRLWPELVLFHTWPLWRAWRGAWWPLGQVSRLSDALFRRLAGRTDHAPEEKFEDEIRTIVTEGHREGLIEEDARGMIEGVIEMREAEVSEIMTPRTDMVSMHVGKSISEAAHCVIEGGHSRVPIYDKSRDDIVGVLYAKDLLEEFARASGKPSRPLLEIVRQPYFVPESKPVHDLLGEFRKTRNHMAVVLDEYGGVSGLVTIEDVLEEIVGEIADEYDDVHVEDIKQIDSHTAEVLARVHIDEINSRLGAALAEDGDFDTIGGFVFSELGRLPRVGEVVEAGKVRITVLDVTRRRIERVRIQILDETPSESA